MARRETWLNGSRDLRVPPDIDLPAIETAGNTRYKLLKLDGLNHLFQHAGMSLPGEHGKITETLAPEALSDIRGWILAQ